MPLWQELPLLLVVGKREAENGSVAVRRQGAGQKQEVIALDEFVGRKRAIAARRRARSSASSLAAVPADQKEAVKAALLVAADKRTPEQKALQYLQQAEFEDLYAATTYPTGRPLYFTIDDYTKWRTIDASAISPDGKWVAYGMRFTNVVAPDAKSCSTKEG